MHDLLIQEWNANITQSSKGKNYHIFKENTELESYLKLLPKKLYISIIKFRTSNHKLPVETGRWENIPYGERKCSLCNKNDIGDKFHYLLVCPLFQEDRCNLFKPFYYQRPILTHLAYTVSGKKSCSNLQQFTGLKCVTLFSAVL